MDKTDRLKYPKLWDYHKYDIKKVLFSDDEFGDMIITTNKKDPDNIWLSGHYNITQKAITIMEKRGYALQISTMSLPPRTFNQMIKIKKEGNNG